MTRIRLSWVWLQIQEQGSVLASQRPTTTAHSISWGPVRVELEYKAFVSKVADSMNEVPISSPPNNPKLLSTSWIYLDRVIQEW
jgi:hypothetical protein